MERLVWLKQPRFYLLAGLAVILGALIGGLAALFWTALYAGIDFVWQTIPAQLGIDPDAWWYIVPVVMAGSVLVGLCQHFLGDYPKQMKEEMQVFRERGRFDTAHIPQGMLTSFVSLAAGASLGPEAALFGLGGGLSTLAADQVKRISDSQTSAKLAQRVLLVLGMVAGGIVMIVGARLGGVIGEGGFFDAEAYQFAWSHLLWAIPAGLVGALAGALFFAGERLMKRLGAHLAHMPFRRALLGGVIFALMASVFPLTLFSGQQHLIGLQLHGQGLSALTLFLSGTLKVIAVSLLLNLGWKGGIFLPLMTGAAILGLLFTLFNPSLPALAPMVAAMAGIVVVTFDNAFVALLMMAFLAPLSSLGVTIVAVLVSVAGVRLVRWAQTQSPQQLVPQDEGAAK